MSQNSIVAADSGTIMSKVDQRQWSDLPSDLISEIADRLGLVEVVRFRSVCQAWNSASSSASAKIESLQNYEPWFLYYDEDSDQCQLVTTENGNITMTLPELDASTTCIASYQGWLLVFKQGGSMFFFRPFSKTKIDIPKFPKSELSDHVAAFSSPPTCSDCTVCLISRSNDDQLDLNLLRRGGGNEWEHYKLDCPRRLIDTIKCGGYAKVGEFYFLNHKDQHLSLKVTSENNKTTINCRTWACKVSAPKETSSPRTYYRYKNYITKAEMLNKLGLAADLHEDVSLSICGTQTELNGIDKFIFNEIINTSDSIEGSGIHRKFKGVWIYPKFYQTSPKEQSW